VTKLLEVTALTFASLIAYNLEERGTGFRGVHSPAVLSIPSVVHLQFDGNAEAAAWLTGDSASCIPVVVNPITGDPVRGNSVNSVKVNPE
jgi:hypothetical protein